MILWYAPYWLEVPWVCKYGWRLPYDVELLLLCQAQQHAPLLPFGMGARTSAFWDGFVLRRGISNDHLGKIQRVTLDRWGCSEVLGSAFFTPSSSCLTMISISSLARWFASSVPKRFTGLLPLMDWDSGTILTRAPDRRWISLIDSPPRPMISPTHLSGTVNVSLFGPEIRLLSLDLLDAPGASRRVLTPRLAMLVSTSDLIAALAALTWEMDPTMLATRTPGLLWDSGVQS